MIRLHLAPLILLATPAVIAAQETPDTARVPAVVVTATRTPLRADQVPASATVVTGAELRAHGITHIADALRAVPGVVVAQAGSYGAPTSLFVRGGQSNYTKVLIDGVPANEPGGAFDFGTLTVDDVERIEIVRGPSSVVWGSDAVSAVVHIITKQGMHDRATVTARGGSLGTVDASGSVERTRGPWRAALTGAHHESDGIYDLNSDYRNSLASGSAGWLGAAGSLRIGGRYARTRAHFPTDFTGAPVDPNAYRDEERTNVFGEVARTLSAATVRLHGGQTLVNGSSVDPRNAAVGTSSAFDTRMLRKQLELRADVPVVERVNAVVGGIAEWQQRASASTAIAVPAAGPPQTTRGESYAERKSQGLFAELITMFGGTTATIGGRYDHSSVYGDFTTYRVGVSYLLPTATRLRGSVGTAFREPSFDEVLPSAFSAGNPDIRPEHSTSWEIGAEQQFVDGELVIGVTWFAQRFTDMIDYFAETFPGRYENVAAARARGTELEARVEPAEGVTIDGSVTFLRTRIESAGFGSLLADGRSLLRRPERTGAVGITYAGTRATLGARLTYVGERQDVRFLYDAPFSREETMPRYAKVDLSAELPLLTRNGRSVALTGRVDNVFEADFEPAAGYQAPGRVILAGVRAAF